MHIKHQSFTIPYQIYGNKTIVLLQDVYKKREEYTYFRSNKRELKCRSILEHISSSDIITKTQILCFSIISYWTIPTCFRSYKYPRTVQYWYKYKCSGSVQYWNRKKYTSSPKYWYTSIGQY